MEDLATDGVTKGLVCFSCVASWVLHLRSLPTSSTYFITRILLDHPEIITKISGP